MYCIIPLAGPDCYDKCIRPLQEIDGKPLIEKVIASRQWFRTGELTTDKIVFILREHEKRSVLEKYLKTHFDKCQCVVLPNITKGALLSSIAGIVALSNFSSPLCIDLADLIYKSDFSPTEIFKNNRPLSKLALFEKTVDFSADLSANFEDISKDMAEKLTDKDAKKSCFSEQMRFRKRSNDVLGIIPYFISNNEKYSYLTLIDNNVTAAVEKKVISNYASAGTYFFKDVSTFLLAAAHTIKQEDKYSYNGNLFLCPSFNALLPLGYVRAVCVDMQNEISLQFHTLAK